MKEATSLMHIREMRGILWEYCEQLHANTLDNLDGLDTFLERYKVQKPNQEEVEGWLGLYKVKK